MYCLLKTIPILLIFFSSSLLAEDINCFYDASKEMEDTDFINVHNEIGQLYSIVFPECSDGIVVDLNNMFIRQGESLLLPISSCHGEYDNKDFKNLDLSNVEFVELSLTDRTGMLLINGNILNCYPVNY